MGATTSRPADPAVDTLPHRPIVDVRFTRSGGNTVGPQVALTSSSPATANGDGLTFKATPANTLNTNSAALITSVAMTSINNNNTAHNASFQLGTATQEVPPLQANAPAATAAAKLVASGEASKPRNVMFVEQALGTTTSSVPPPNSAVRTPDGFGYLCTPTTNLGSAGASITPSTSLTPSIQGKLPAMNSTAAVTTQQQTAAGSAARAGRLGAQLGSLTPASSILTPATSVLTQAASGEIMPASSTTTAYVTSSLPAALAVSKADGNVLAGGPARTLSTSQKVQAAMRSAAADWKTGGMGAAGTVRNMVTASISRRGIIVTLDQLLSALFFIVLSFQVLFLMWLRPSLFRFVFFLVIGTLVGLSLSFVYYANKRAKAEVNQVLGLELGLKGLQHLLGSLPSWLSYTQREKVEWLNSLLEEVWPFYDKGVCNMIKAETEQLFENVIKNMKAPGLRKVYFKHLTFGDAPFRVESVFCDETRGGEVLLDVDVRWCGEANITLAVELLAGERTKVCPRVTDVSFVGCLRIVLKPLVNDVPGFAAVVVTFKKPPLIKYALNFGTALGGGYVAKIVTPFIDHVVHNVMLDMLVWPQRLVVPMPMPHNRYESRVEALGLRSVGVLKVVVERASGLLPRNPLITQKVHGLVQLTTDNMYYAETSSSRGTLEPSWNETRYLLVQEPKDQFLRVTVLDQDMFSPKELLTLQLHNAVNSRHMLARAMLDLKDVCASEGMPVARKLQLGTGDWSAPSGPGKGHGALYLRLMYRSFLDFKLPETTTSQRGVLMVTVQEVRRLRPASGRKDLCSFVRVKVDKRDDPLSTPLVVSTGHPKFKGPKASASFYDVSVDSVIKVKVMESVVLLTDDVLGMLELSVSEVAEAMDVDPLTGVAQAGLHNRWQKLEESDSAAEVRLLMRFIPEWQELGGEL